MENLVTISAASSVTFTCRRERQAGPPVREARRRDVSSYGDYFGGSIRIGNVVKSNYIIAIYRTTKLLCWCDICTR